MSPALKSVVMPLMAAVVMLMLAMIMTATIVTFRFSLPDYRLRFLFRVLFLTSAEKNHRTERRKSYYCCEFLHVISPFSLKELAQDSQANHGILRKLFHECAPVA